MKGVNAREYVLVSVKFKSSGTVACLAYTLQLVVKDGCLAQPAVVDLTAKGCTLMGHYKPSNVALQALLKIQGLPSKRLIQDDPTT